MAMREFDGLMEQKSEGDVTVFLCGPEPVDIFSAVYEAWASKWEPTKVRLELASDQRQSGLFCQYITVERDLTKAETVRRGIIRKISNEAYSGVYRAALSFEPDRADAIYRFWVEGFGVGADLIHRLQDPVVCRVFELGRKVNNEAHRLMGFVRFVRCSNGLLFARINPKCNVLSLIAPHFDDRLSGYSWMIYDETYHKLAVHRAGETWFLVDALDTSWEKRLRSLNYQADGQQWEDLWRTFVTNIAIEPRRNLSLQQNLMPLHYRKNMTEFQEKTVTKTKK